MKNVIKLLIAASLMAVLATSCLEDVTPSQGFTQQQLNQSSEQLDLLSAAVKRGMFYRASTSIYYNCGYAGYMLVRDAMCAESAVQSTSYDYFSWWEEGTYLGKSYGVCSDIWNFYYRGVIQKCNLALAVANPSPQSSSDDMAKIGNALCYRALAYMDLTRFYEYKATGYPELDEQATYNITVPIVDEYTTEVQDRNNPRAPFYKMYRFIMNDLNMAEFYLQGYYPSRKNDAGIAVVYGLKARMWLEIGSRLEQKPDDLAELLAHENDEDLAKYDKLGITSAADCYANAAKYSKWAMNLPYTPVTQEQWYDLKTGFNTANDAWMWAVQYSSEDVTETYVSFPGFLAPEASYGVANSTYKANRMIDARLYQKVPKSDWRYYTWIAAEDAGTTAGYNKYKTTYSSSDWAQFQQLTGFKFRPGDGNGSDYLTGNAIDIPLMRIEEMYLINAEATARTQGVEAGKEVLNSFLNNYRYTDRSYRSTSTTLDEFILEVLDQKRIELWGEGLVMWDYKRCNRAVVRDYAGSNHPDVYKIHSKDDYTAPWMNIVISQTEERYNLGITANNPDPSGYHDTY